MPTASPEPNNHLKPGEINFDLIPKDWALTPLQGKRAYIAGSTTQTNSVEKIKLGKSILSLDLLSKSMILYLIALFIT